MILPKGLLLQFINKVWGEKVYILAKECPYKKKILNQSKKNDGLKRFFWCTLIQVVEEKMLGFYKLLIRPPPPQPLFLLAKGPAF